MVRRTAIREPNERDCRMWRIPSLANRVRPALAAVLLAALPVPAWAVSAPLPLLRAVRAPSLVAYAGEQMVVTWDGRDVSASLVRVEHDPAGWTRLDYRPVGSASRWTVLRRGTEEIPLRPPCGARARA